MSTWHVEEPLEDAYLGGVPTPLASLVYLGKALRRRWRTLVVIGLIGMALAAGYTRHYPPKSTAEVALSLQHPTGSDPAAAMQTDVAILTTRAVASRTLAALDEQMSPDDFLKTYSGTATTSTVLTITVQAPGEQAAVRTARTLASTYLDYRAGQMQTSTTAQLAGVQSQIASLREQLAAAQAQYAQFQNIKAQTSTANAALQQIVSLRSQIGSLETTVRTAQNATHALVDSSTVLDPAAAVPSSPAKHLVLTLMTGLIGGVGLGAGIVVLDALVSTRLRRREDIALAAGAPVTHTVPRLPAHRVIRPARSHHRTGRRTTASSHALQVLAQGLESAVDVHGVSRLALVTLDNEDAGLAVAAFAGAQLSSERKGVFLVDLSRSGRLAKKARRAVGAAVRPSVAPTVYRPDGPPPFACGPLAAGPGRSSDLGVNDPTRARWDAADVVIAVAPADLDTGLDHLAGWAETAVLLITAGASSAETVTTTAGLLRSAGLEVRAVLMIGTDRTDQSLGRLLDHTEARRADTMGRVTS